MTKDGKTIEKATAFCYFWQLGIILTCACQKEYIKHNPWKLLSPHEKIQRPESKRDYLTLEEVDKLEHTPYKKDVVRQAFLFACYCGLRISDIVTLHWRNITRSMVVGGMCRWQCTKTRNRFHFLCQPKHCNGWPKRGDADSPVFSLLEQATIRRHVKKWAEQAGINHDICFHTSRHTYGTMLITAGVDLYTASKMMGHADVRTTQIYAKIVDSKKIEAVGMVDKMFEQRESEDMQG